MNQLGTPSLGFSPLARRQSCLAKPVARFALPVALALLAACRTAQPLPPGGVIGTAPDKAPAPLAGHNLLFNDDFTEGTRSLPWTA